MSLEPASAGALSPKLAFISLDPPLPCVVSGPGLHGAGFVHALASDRVLVRLAGATVSTQVRALLTISLDARESFALACSLAPTAEATTVEAQVDTHEALTRLANLLTVVRKSQHIAICETMDVEASDRYTGFDDLLLMPRALPDLSWHQLDTRRRFLGRDFALPLLITGMTGGLERGAEINRRLALAAQAFGIPMGVGSQRIALEHPEHEAIFAVKKAAPKVFLIANLGAAQLSRGAAFAIDACKRAVEMIEADALAIHVNVLQEVIQVEGDRDFRGLEDRIAEIASALHVPVMVKEVGVGIDPESARRLMETGIAAIDVGGKGGTSWSYIEGFRARSDVTRAVADTFRDWGIPTACALHMLRSAHPRLDLVATGGLRDGLAAAKAVALGATMAGIGLPIFRAALKSEEAPHEVLATFERGLKTAMICSGAGDLAALGARLRTTPRFLETLQSFGGDTRDLAPQQRT